MRIPAEAVVPAEKLTDYLLTPRLQDDKPKFLAQAGFGFAAPEVLLTAIRQLAAAEEADEDGRNEYGTFYRAVGPLQGPNGRALRVITIWLQWKTDGTFHFVTLKPWRGDTDATL